MKYFVSFVIMKNNIPHFGNQVIDHLGIERETTQRGIECIEELENRLNRLTGNPVIISFQKLGLSENEVRLPRRTK